MRKMSARERCMAHRKYFDGSLGEEGSIDDVSVAHDGNNGSERVFRYRGGTRIPRSPSKIRAGGCPRAELEEKLKFYKWVNRLLNEHRGVRVSGHPKISFPDIMVIVSPNVKF
jgi:hypothetical protein